MTASRDDRRAGGGIIRVEDAGLDAGARLDRDLGAEPDHFLTVSGVAATRGSPASASGSNRNLHGASDGGLRARPGFKPDFARGSRRPLTGTCDSASSSDEENRHQNEDDDDDTRCALHQCDKCAVHLLVVGIIVPVAVAYWTSPWSAIASPSKLRAADGDLA